MWNHYALQEIDTYLDHATEQGYSAFLTLGSRLLAFVTNAVLTGAARGQTTLAEHLSRSGYGGVLQDDMEDSAGNEAGNGDSDNGNGEPVVRRRRRGRGRTSESADADESANAILRAAYRREVASAGDDDGADKTTS